MDRKAFQAGREVIRKIRDKLDNEVVSHRGHLKRVSVRPFTATLPAWEVGGDSEQRRRTKRETVSAYFGLNFLCQEQTCMRLPQVY